jgi:hypothetical protein
VAVKAVKSEVLSAELLLTLLEVFTAALFSEH